MAAALHVRLNSALKREPVRASLSVLTRQGPSVCIGGSRGEHDLPLPVRPDAVSLFGPRGGCLTSERGPLWISDTGHHRLLGWAEAPIADGVPADWVIGQPDFFHEGRNARGAAGAATLNVPTGIVAVGGGLAVADAWNHRVLLWSTVPRDHHIPADVVLGQADFDSVAANRGAPPAADTLFWPYGVFWDGARLLVADTGNRRVLLWDGIPQENGQPADRVLGQPGFHCRDENGGGAPSACSMRWPHAIARWGGALCVADAGNNRIMVWDESPAADNVPCDRVLGQRDFAAVDHNQSLYWPGAATLHMPYGVAACGEWCIAADTANSRLIAWHRSDAGCGAAARALTGQGDFTAKGDNAWQAPTRASLSWPYAVTTCSGTACIADSGNNRVLLWRLAPELLQ
jgi:hypothetical protein